MSKFNAQTLESVQPGDYFTWGGFKVEVYERHDGQLYFWQPTSARYVPKGEKDIANHRPFSSIFFPGMSIIRPNSHSSSKRREYRIGRAYAKAAGFFYLPFQTKPDFKPTILFLDAQTPAFTPEQEERLTKTGVTVIKLPLDSVPDSIIINLCYNLGAVLLSCDVGLSLGKEVSLLEGVVLYAQSSQNWKLSKERFVRYVEGNGSGVLSGALTIFERFSITKKPLSDLKLIHEE